ncbi:MULTISPECIES: cadherin repeat domain-containing protein [unclassified Fibrobacter]|uniref:cadherin repeat domain-containing protein n=1 Tax=unclassified Fibrobacter TaxID=2634177 RepID=UPI000D6DABBF|nr:MULTISPECIES: cadherin repeat domain-containing protein [unclassified Fibrobacter]PWJ71834.1 cadherin domain-containing protein [Fibrobacter sp. UWR4]PZW73749.1 cadherin domain-containing protein [Fibrobacter sp. UWR1]
MRFEIGLVKRFALALAMVVSVGFAADLEPFQFLDAATGHDVQQKEWNKLLKYKLWGTGKTGEYGVAFIGQKVFVTDSSGYSGSAKGYLRMSNTHHTIGGPLSFGGGFFQAANGQEGTPVDSYSNGDGNDTISTGPSHFGGDFYVSFNARDKMFIAGNLCVDGTVTRADQGLANGHGNLTCTASDIPEIDATLDVPTVNYAMAGFAFDREVASINVINEKFIDIPKGEGVFDLHVKGDIKFENNAALYVRMPAGGRLTRIFLDGKFDINSTQHNIGVMYATKDATWNGSTWSKAERVENKDYAGNLLFYTPEDISFPTEECNIQGTFISQGEIFFKQHYKFAGQLLAKRIKIDAEFRAQDFIYVPFDPPTFKHEANSWGQLKEGVSGPQKLSVALTKKPETQVTFDYCFIFNTTKNGDAESDEDNQASEADVAATSERYLCSKGDVGHAKFLKGDSLLAEPITLTIADDNYVENEEFFTIHVFNLRGAVSDTAKQETFEGDFDISIIDDDDRLISKDTNVNMLEDTPYTFGRIDFPVMARDGSEWTGEYAIRIVTPPYYADSLKIDNKPVDYNGVHPVYSSILEGKLNGWHMVYYPPKDLYGDKLDSLEYVVMRNSSKSESVYKLYFNVKPVNDAPVVDSTQFTIEENSAAGTEVTGTLKVTDVDDKIFSYAFDSADKNYEKVSSLFAIDSKTGVITAKGALNYESADSVLTIGISVKDSSKSTGDYKDALTTTKTVSIRLIDVNEKPVMEPQSFEVMENSKKGTEVGTVVATDPDRSTVDFGKLVFSIPETENVPFAVSSSGVITVTDSTKLDYEKVKSISFNVIVSDKGDPSLKDIALVTINIEDENEPPEFIDDGKDHYDVNEHVADNFEVARLKFVDGDAADSKITDFVPTLTDNKKTSGKVSAEDLFSLSIEKDAESDTFYVVISVADSAKLDYEKLAASEKAAVSFDVTISIKDNEGKAGYNEISIDRKLNVIDVNEAPTAKPFSKEIAENLPTGSVVGTVEASDPDTKNATYSKLTYSIPVNEDASTANDVPFTINASTGVITVKDGSKLDYETNPSFTFKVEVKDIEYTATSTVTITLSDEEEPPEIIPDPSCDEEKEDCCDPNLENCSDPIDPPDTTCVTNCGYIKGDTLYVNVRENSKTGTQILKYYVKDQDAGDLVSMKVYFEDVYKSGADSLFIVSPTLTKDTKGNYYFTLTVKDGSKLDFEKVNETHVLRIIAKDDGGKSDAIVRVIKVVDLNEKPVVEDSKKEIKENLPNGTPVDTLVAYDPDTKHVKEFGTLSYEILDSANVPFTLDSKNPKIIKVKDRTKLDYEKTSSFTFYVRVTDGTLADTATITLTLTDEEEPPEIIEDDPKCDEEKEDCHKCDATIQDCGKPVEPPVECTENCGYMKGDTVYVNVRENSKTGTKILEYYVKDQDAGDLESMEVTFENKNKSGADSLFAITKKLDKDADGDYKFVLSVKDSAKLNYEKINEVHRLLIIVKDDGGKADSILRVIKVVDVNEAPTIKDNLKGKVDENSKVGVVAATMSASDPDIKHPEIYGKLTYTVVEEGTPFKMDSNKVVVADGSMLNYEKDSLYTIHVRVTDGEFAATALVQIKLNNTNEEPFIKCLEDDDNCEGPYDIAENSATGTEIHTFAVMDDDKDPAYRLNSASISDMQGTNARDLFAIKFNVDSSQVTVYVKDGSKLDYEKVQPSYTVKIKISDAMGVADSVIRVINVIDVNEAPSIADSSFAVAENTKNGTVIGSLRASDPDIKNVLFSSLSYEIVDEVPFKMDSNKIVVADSKSLNYEKVTEFYFDVRVTDGGNLTDLATVYVKLSNVDEPPQIDTIPPCDPEVEVCHACDATIEDCDNEDDPPPPTCTENCGYMKGDTVYVNVREDAPAGTKILEYYVNDEDAGDLETMKVTFVDNNKSGSDTLFTITPTLVKDEKGYKFVLAVTDSVDYETTKHSHQMTIIVEDAAGLKDSVFRVINIVDVNEPPYIVKADFDLKEHNKEGATVGTIEWGDDRDMDGVSNPAFRDNRVVAVDGATDIFDVDSLGVITVKKTLNYETDDSTYTLIVSVVDKTDPTLKSTETMTIHLKNIPETPVITSTEFSVDENPADRKVIGTLTSEDLDDLKNEETRTYTLIGTSEFVKVTENGEIVVINKDKFDYETVDSFTIKVKVTDPQGVSSDTTVTIKINDVNEAPNLDDKPITVSEHTAPGTVIDTLKATDPDKDPTKRELTYTIVDGDTSLFEIDSKTGVITLKDSLDYEKAKEHILKVEVSDGEFADIAKITVNVENVEEKSVVEIQMVDDGDSLWVRPDSVYTNRTDVTICWTEDGRDYCSDTTMTEGIHTIIKTFKDPKKDFPGADTVVIQISTSAPQVIVSAKADGLSDGSIFTLDEGVLAGDTNIYVNDSKNDIQVTIKDPVNKKDSTFTVKLDLETVDVSDKDLESVSNIAEKGKLTLNENPKIPASRTPVNGSEVKVFYTEEVDGKKVEVSYYTDKNGDVLKTPVIIDGKVDSIEVITVSYETKIGGRDVVVSYQADAITGQVLNVSSDGMLTYDDKIVVESVPDGKPSAKDTTVSNTTEVSVGSYKVTYEYEDEKHNTIVVTYTVDEKGNIVKNGDGDIGYKVSYTYENKFGNSATQSVFIVLDQKPPVVKIVSPEYGSKIRANSVEVVWTVNGVVQDTLTLQGLKKGFQWIKREYRDKAGNTAVDSVAVQVKDAKSMEIEVVEAVTEMNVEKVEEYYASNPPKKGETFAVSVANPSTGKEVEALTGGSYGQEDGTFKTPYPGVEGNGHLGPTLAMEVRLPVVNDVAGLATFDDLILSDGTISSRGVNSDRCKMAEEYEAMGLVVDTLVKDTSVCVKFTQEQYVEKFCEDDVDLTGDLSKINLYSTRMHAKVWIYTSIGGFVDYYNFKVDLNDPDYTDNAGVLNMYFEQKPDKNGEIHTEDGRVMATGAYLYKVEADIRAKLRCSLPPFDEVSSTNKKKGSVVKKSDELLKPFGYKRPSKK